jgi:poly [ADP-ribose] polymerase
MTTNKVSVKNLLIDDRCTVKGTIVESDGKLYNCALNQTDIKSNKNKFYIMQLIKSGSAYHLFIVFGRVGESGKPRTVSQTSEAAGIKAFEKQFKAKTGNVWGTDNFVKKSGKYFMSEVSYDDEIKDMDDVELKIPPSKLDKKVQELITMLSDTNMMQDSLVSLNIDTKKMPLGKLKNSQLKKAEKILDEIQKILNDKTVPDADKLTDLSSEYYTFLPVACGRRKPPVIKDDKLIDKYKEVIEELRNMVVAVEIKKNIKAGDNPLDGVYAGINTEINALDKDSQMYEEIVKYVNNTQGATHNWVKLKVLDIYEVKQNGKKEKFDKCCDGIENKMLLWHGSGLSNWLSICKNDLWLDPAAMNSSVYVSGKMFGMGLYFANCVSKSWNYCRTDATKGIGCLALAEVPLGNISKRINSDYSVNHKSLQKTGHNSVQGMGKVTPSTSVTIDGVIIPNGPLEKTNVGAYLQYDEFIVYQQAQQLIKYLVIIKNEKY